MRILITGSRGQLGSELAKILAAGCTKLGAIPCCYNNAIVTAVDIDELDIGDAQAVNAFFETQHPFDLILNCAALTNVDGCESNPVAAMRTNAIGARNIAKVTERNGAKLVHVSTDYVFAGNGSIPYAEWDICAPNTIYGKSKLLGEQYVREVCSTAFVVRTSWLYGYVGNNFVKTIIKIAKEQGSLKVVNDQRGNPTNAEDLAHHMLLIAATDYYGIYHCTGAGECSWYDFAQEIVRLLGIPCVVTPCTTLEYPRLAPRPAYSALDHLMLRSTVGDNMQTWQESLAYFIENYKENGELQ